jgi:hypothetical protein
MSLTNDEHMLLFDYYFRCADSAISKQASSLVRSNPKASQFYSSIERALGQLNNMKEQDCPDELVDLTIARLKLASFKRTAP